MQSTPETWRPVPGYEGSYEVSDHGNVRNTRTGKQKAPRALPGGHILYELWVGNKRTRLYAHRLVATTFIGAGPNGQEVCHNDGDPQNNHVSNLRWGTRSENILDEVEAGRHWQTRKTHCAQGHEFTPENTLTVKGRGRRDSRKCRTCNRAWQNAYSTRKRARSGPHT